MVVKGLVQPGELGGLVVLVIRGFNFFFLGFRLILLLLLAGGLEVKCLAIGCGLGCQGVLDESLDEVCLLKVYHAVKRVVSYLEAIRCPSSVPRVPRVPP